MALRHPLALLLLAACHGPATAHTGFGSTPEVTTTSATTEAATDTSTTSTDASTSIAATTDTESDPARDLGPTPDFGDGAPVGCKGKIDFLFVISSDGNMRFNQEQLAIAVPQFIQTIEQNFADFDYHIMVVTGAEGWGAEGCTVLCPDLACKVGEPCCHWYDPAYVGKPCCNDPVYPCDKLDLVTQCDEMWGAGEVFPAGPHTQDRVCPIDGGRRYLVKGQKDLAATFECIAMVGTSGGTLLGQAVAAAVQHTVNGPGGCNGGFVRKDALLMVTFAAANPDQESDGTPADWAQAIIDAKYGDVESIIMFNIGGGIDNCLPFDRICQLTEMFPYRHGVNGDTDEYAPGFVEATKLVETACAGFIPPG